LWIKRTGVLGAVVLGAVVLGAVMAETERAKSERPAVLDVVALLADAPAEGLARGQVGTVVESLGEDVVLVEFSDEQGRPYVVAPCPRSQLLVLHYEPHEA
jgi:hypothetical protein